MRIGNIQATPWYLRLMMFVAVAAVMYAGFWYFITRPTRAQTKEINTEIAELRAKNAQAQIASQRLNEFRAVYKAREEEYEELKALLPEQRELTMVLQGVQDPPAPTD
jgi:Tfp pilus assembly protein PilO